MPYVKVKDISIYYESYGSEANSPLVLVMGLAATKLGWEIERVKRLARKHRVIVFDNRGSGQSDMPDAPYSMALFAADTVGLMDALKIDKAHIFGISMGGMIAQHIALDYPERTLSLIMGCTTPGGKRVVPSSREVTRVLLQPKSGDRAKDARDKWPIMYTPAFIESERELLESRLELKLAYPEQPRYAFERQFETIIKTHNTFDRLPELKMPVLIQTGLDDVLIPPGNAHLLAGQISQANLIEYPNAGHGYFLETGFKAADDVLVFLDEVDGQKSF